MQRYVALLRAVNVGGTGRLLMADLSALCREAGFLRVETYIASGNVVFDSAATASKIKTELEARLAAHARKSVGVAVRTSAEMRAIVDASPFQRVDSKRAYVIFLDEPPPADALRHAVGREDEDMYLGVREIYAYYPGGMGKSKLRIPAAKAGTARNMNTVARLAMDRALC